MRSQWALSNVQPFDKLTVLSPAPGGPEGERAEERGNCVSRKAAKLGKKNLGLGFILKR